MTAAGSVGLIFTRDVFGERPFSPFAVISKAARADFTRSVTDDPCGAPDKVSVAVPFFWFEPQSGSFCMTRHFSLISSIARSVVNCLPAMTSIVSLPLLASRRRPDTVIPPSGNASSTARLRRSGVSGPIFRRSTGGSLLVILWHRFFLRESRGAARQTPVQRCTFSRGVVSTDPRQSMGSICT